MGIDIGAKVVFGTVIDENFKFPPNYKEIFENDGLHEAVEAWVADRSDKYSLHVTGYDDVREVVVALVCCGADWPDFAKLDLEVSRQDLGQFIAWCEMHNLDRPDWYVMPEYYY